MQHDAGTQSADRETNNMRLWRVDRTAGFENVDAESEGVTGEVAKEDESNAVSASCKKLGAGKDKFYLERRILW